MKTIECYYETFNDELLYEYVIHKNFSLKDWNMLKKTTEGKKKISELKKKDKNKKVWKVVHGHKKSKMGESIYKKEPLTTLEKANARLTAINLN